MQSCCEVLENIVPVAGLSAESFKNNIQPISGLWQRCHDDCDPDVLCPICLSISCLSSISPLLPVKSFCSSTIWCVTKEEQFYFFIGVQESEYSVCLMLLNTLRLKESAWISQCRLTPSVHLHIIHATSLLFPSFDIWLLQLQKVTFCHDQSFMLRTSRSFVGCSVKHDSFRGNVKIGLFSNDINAPQARRSLNVGILI